MKGLKCWGLVGRGGIREEARFISSWEKIRFGEEMKSVMVRKNEERTGEGEK